MDGSQFDTLLRGLTTARSRRGAVVGLLGGTLGLFGLTETEAKHKHKKHKKHKKPPGSGSPPASPPVSPPPSPPASPPPGRIATADATCGASGGRVIGLRQAQTFLALRSGQLTSATVFLSTNDSGADIDVEIWSTDGAGAPREVLAGVAIADVPATDAPGGDPPRRLSATFSGPATVVAGLRYAVVITGPDGSFGLDGARGNPCPDGNAFFASARNEALRSDPNLDLHFETIVTG
jgi:hypothetical protein